MPAKNNTLRDAQGNYAGQGSARRTYYMLFSSGCHFEALKALGKVEPIDGWALQEGAKFLSRIVPRVDCSCLRIRLWE